MFLTADDRAGSRVLEGYRLGAVDYLYKPFDPEILRSKVAFFVDLFRKTAALEQRTAELTHDGGRARADKEYFRALIENASDLTLIVDATAIIRYASPSVERTLGYPRDQIPGES